MPHEIAVYGASGSLGQRVAHALVARGAGVRAGGRDAGALGAADALRLAGVEQVVAPLDDDAAMRALLGKTRVLVNAARLSAADNHRLIARALEAGVHYIDAAGEQAYIGGLFARYGETAQRRGTAVVPACGFDYALGDCLAHLVARGRQPAREVIVAYAIDGADVSANSLQFAAETTAGGEVLFENGGWTPARLEILRRQVDFPLPFGVQAMARYASGEVLTVPRHVSTLAVTALITATSLVPDRRLVPLFPYLRPVVAILRRTPARHLLGIASRLQRAGGARSGGTGSDAPAPPRFAIVVEVEPLDGDAVAPARRGVVEGRDYHRVTAGTLSFVATELAKPLADKQGVLPPSGAVDPTALLDDLAHLGVTWRVG